MTSAGESPTCDSHNVEVTARHLSYLVAVKGFDGRREMEAVKVLVTVGGRLQHTAAPRPHSVVLCARRAEVMRVSTTVCMRARVWC
jgi:hypothetical protein